MDKEDFELFDLSDEIIPLLDDQDEMFFDEALQTQELLDMIDAWNYVD